MKAMHFLPLFAAIAAAAVIASGFGARFGLWDYRAGFQILRWSTYAAIAISVVGVVAIAIPKLRRRHAAALFIGLALALGAAALPIYWLQQARSLPPINDITTDTADPPAFLAVLALRRDAPVSASYPGVATATAQRAGYPDIAPVRLAMPPSEAFEVSLRAAQDMDWDIVAADRAAGRIEATATTRWFGFKDDVVVRIRPEVGGSRVDVRSLSRVGRGDLGANARRIRAFVARIER